MQVQISLTVATPKGEKGTTVVINADDVSEVVKNIFDELDEDMLIKDVCDVEVFR